MEAVKKGLTMHTPGDTQNSLGLGIYTTDPIVDPQTLIHPSRVKIMFCKVNWFGQRQKKGLKNLWNYRLWLEPVKKNQLGQWPVMTVPHFSLPRRQIFYTKLHTTSSNFYSHLSPSYAQAITGSPRLDLTLSFQQNLFESIHIYYY